MNMNKEEWEMVELGRVYRDRISEFEGVAVSRTIYLHGCVRVGLEGKAKPGEMIFFDEQRLVSFTPAGSGGPQEAPPARDPK